MIDSMHKTYLIKSGGVEKPYYVFLRDMNRREDTVYGFGNKLDADKYAKNYKGNPENFDVHKRMQMDGSLKKYAQGGLLQGSSHTNGGILLEAEGGEYILNKAAVSEVGVPYLDYLNDEGGLPFMRFGMGELLKQDQEVGMAEINSSDGELKALVRELIQTIKEGDSDIVEALDEIDPNVDVNVYTDLEGEVAAQISAYDAKVKEQKRRGR